MVFRYVLFLRQRYLSRPSTRILVEVQEKDVLFLDKHLANSCTIPRQRSLSSFRTSPGSDISFSGNANRSTRVLQLPLGPPCGCSVVVVVVVVVRRFERCVNHHPGNVRLTGMTTTNDKTDNSNADTSYN